MSRLKRAAPSGRAALVERIIRERLAFAPLAHLAGFDETGVRDAILGLRDKPEIRVHGSEVPRHMLPGGFPLHCDLILHEDGSLTPDPADPGLAGTRWAPADDSITWAGEG